MRMRTQIVFQAALVKRACLPWGQMALVEALVLSVVVSG